MTDWTRDFPWQQARQPTGGKPNKNTILQAPAQLEHTGIPVPFSQVSFSPEALAAQAAHEEELGLRLQAEAQGIEAAANRNDGSGGPQGIGPAIAAFQDPIIRQKMTDIGGTGSTVHGFEPASSPTPVPQAPQPGNLRSDFTIQPAQNIQPLAPSPAVRPRFDPPAPDHLANYVRNQTDWQHPVNQQLQTMINVQDSLPPPPRPQVQTPDPMFNNWQSPIPQPAARIPNPEPIYRFNNPTQSQMIQFLARLPR